MKTDEISLGRRLKELRHQKKMTQQELAKLLFVSDKTVSKWEKDGSIPDIDILIDLSEIFNVSLDYLLTGNKDKGVSRGCRAIYSNGKLDHYVGEDGDRLFTRDEVTVILNKRIVRHDQQLVTRLGFSSMKDLENVATSFKLLKEIMESESIENH